MHYSPVLPPDLRIDAARLEANLDQIVPGSNNLFAFPAQSNFSGVQHDLAWIERAQAKGWDVLLDAAAFAPTNRLDLSQHQPDFVSLSFYKIFGYPTGIGALIARRDKIAKLRRPWFAGGTITIATVTAQKHYLHDGSEGFEDGTIDYLNLPGVEIGLKHIENVGVDQIHERVVSLTGWLLDQLSELKHSNGTAVVRIYGPTTTEMRGGTISLNFYDPERHDHRLSPHRAACQRAEYLAADGLFLQPRRGRNRPRPDRNRTRMRARRTAAHDSAGIDDRAGACAGRAAHFSRHRLQLRRCLSLHAVRATVRRSSSGLALV